jgi:hypothetical protein
LLSGFTLQRQASPDKVSSGPGRKRTSSEHEDFGVLGEGAHVVDAQDLDNATDHTVEEAERPGVAGWPFRSWLVKLRNELLDL